MGTGTQGGNGTAVVIAGGGARGAYEAGALSVLLPALAKDERPQLYVGTSAGAINAAGFASLAHLEPDEAGARIVELWRQLHQGDVLRPARHTAVRNLVTALRGKVPGALLDNTPLWDTLGKRISWDQLRYNVEFATIRGCAAVATHQATHRNVVFTACGDDFELPDDDPVRQIEYRRVVLERAHIIGAAGLPGLPPVNIPAADGAPPDWYVDGGLRLMTPIKPAVALGADRVIVVATSPDDDQPPAGAARPPNATNAIVDIARAILEDSVVTDVRVLRRENKRVVHALATRPDCLPDKRIVPYVFVGPPNRTLLASLVHDVLKRRSWLPPHTLARLVSGDANLCDLTAHLLFDPQFIAGAIELGQEHARTKLRNGRIDWETV